MKASSVILLAALAGFGVSSVLAADASENWDKLCSRCHAKDGSGDTKPGKKLKLKDYRDAAVQAEMTDEAMLKVITEGVTDDKGKKEMPDYTEKLTADERAAMIPFIRALKTN